MNTHIYGLAETKMGIDIFGKELLNATSFRSWNFTSQCLSCRSTGARSAEHNVQLHGPERVLKSPSKGVQIFKNLYINFIRNN